MTPVPVSVNVPGSAPPNSPLSAFNGVSSVYVLVTVTVVFTEELGGGFAGQAVHAVLAPGAVPASARFTRVVGFP